MWILCRLWLLLLSERNIWLYYWQNNASTTNLKYDMSGLCRYRFLSSGMWYREMRYKLTDVSEECATSTSIFSLEVGGSYVQPIYRYISTQITRLNNQNAVVFMVTAVETSHFSGYIPGQLSWYCDGATSWTHGVRVPAGERGILSSPQRPDRLWGSAGLLSKWYWGLFPHG
jgi:hypothetical protein